MSRQRARGRLGPSTISRSTSSMRSSGATPSAADSCAAAASTLPACIGPGHEVIAAETGLAHHVLEGDVGGARHRGHQRPPGRAIGIAGGRRAAPRDWRAPSSRSGRGRRARRSAPGTLASNGNCCSSRVHSAWMVCTFSPPGVSSALANSFRAAIAAARRTGDAGLADRGVERVVVERDPVAERGEHPLRHVGGGGLGEGDAEDLFRRHAVEQQADHALHQHMGLARAGIGRDEGRGAPGSRRGPARREPRAESGGGPSPFLDPQAAGRRPFLDPRQVVISAVAVGPHRQVQRGVGLVLVLEAADQGLRACAAPRRRPRPAAAARRTC